VPAVKAAFDGYRAALKKGDGVAAARIVDNQTLKYYGTMKRMALTALAAKVKQLSFLDRLMIVILRLRVELDRLRAMSSKQLFAHGVEQGWISKNSVANVQLAKQRKLGENELILAHGLSGDEEARAQGYLGSAEEEVKESITCRENPLFLRCI
jgi:hypothetical protein